MNEFTQRLQHLSALLKKNQVSKGGKEGSQTHHRRIQSHFDSLLKTNQQIFEFLQTSKQLRAQQNKLVVQPPKKKGLTSAYSPNAAADVQEPTHVRQISDLPKDFAQNIANSIAVAQTQSQANIRTAKDVFEGSSANPFKLESNTLMTPNSAISRFTTQLSSTMKRNRSTSNEKKSTQKKYVDSSKRILTTESSDHDNEDYKFQEFFQAKAKAMTATAKENVTKRLFSPSQRQIEYFTQKAPQHSKKNSRDGVQSAAPVSQAVIAANSNTTAPLSSQVDNKYNISGYLEFKVMSLENEMNALHRKFQSLEDHNRTLQQTITQLSQEKDQYREENEQLCDKMKELAEINKYQEQKINELIHSTQAALSNKNKHAQSASSLNNFTGGHESAGKSQMTNQRKLKQNGLPSHYRVHTEISTTQDSPDGSFIMIQDGNTPGTGNQYSLSASKKDENNSAPVQNSKDTSYFSQFFKNHPNLKQGTFHKYFNARKDGKGIGKNNEIAGQN